MYQQFSPPPVENVKLQTWFVWPLRSGYLRFARTQREGTLISPSKSQLASDVPLTSIGTDSLAHGEEQVLNTGLAERDDVVCLQPATICE